MTHYRLPVGTASAGLSARDTAGLTKSIRSARRGVNVAGAEFSTGNVVWENPASFAYLAGRGHRLVRLPFLWEKIQPALSGPLDPTTLAGLHATVTAAGSAGLKVVLDVHNYAKYGGTAFGAAGSFTQADFTDLWTRLSLEFRTDPAVVGYGLMNEPGNLPAGNTAWQAAQQAALNAIRGNDDGTCVLVAGYGASSLGGWFSSTDGQPVPYITDPANNFRWEAHHYWDSSGGKYSAPYTTELTNTASWGSGDTVAKKAMFELNKWIAWLKTWDQKGYIGEFGWPSTAGTDATSAASWDALAAQWLTRLDNEGDLIWATAWATGSRWSPGYALQFYTPTGGVLAAPLSNTATLEAHRERGIIGVGRPATPPPLPAFTFPAGSYLFPSSPNNTSTANTLGTGTLRAVPFYTPVALSVARIGAEITAAGDAGGRLRLGVYADNGSGFPGALVIDAGTIAADAVATAEATLASPVTLTPGWYWLAAVVQAVTTTQPTVRIGAAATPGFLFTPGTALPGAGSTAVGYSMTGVTGALPAAWSPTLTPTGAAPRLLLKLT